MHQTNAQANAPRPTPVANFLKYHGSDRVKTDTWNTKQLCWAINMNIISWDKFNHDDLHSIDATIVFSVHLFVTIYCARCEIIID